MGDPLNDSKPDDDTDDDAASPRPTAKGGPFVPLSDFRTRIGRVSREEFISKFPLPVLLLEKKEGDFTDPGFQTVSAKPEAAPAPPRPPKPDGELSATGVAEKHAGIAKKLNEARSALYVCTLEKRDPNKFASMITVGRAANNDIRINLPSVSKFHAYFTHIPRDSLWFVTDANSSNGTWVDGERLRAGSGRARLQNGTAIRIGPDVRVRFFEAKALYDFLVGSIA